VDKGLNAIDGHMGRRVRMRRLMLDFTQAQLADALGLTYQQVQKKRRAPTASAPAVFSSSRTSFTYGCRFSLTGRRESFISRSSLKPGRQYRGTSLIFSRRPTASLL
jgi:transcriptional regulator with XRE-family HTH domain